MCYKYTQPQFQFYPVLSCLAALNYFKQFLNYIKCTSDIGFRMRVANRTLLASGRKLVDAVFDKRNIGAKAAW